MDARGRVALEHRSSAARPTLDLKSSPLPPPPPPPPPKPPKRRKLPSLRDAIAPQGMLSRDARRKKSPSPSGGVIAEHSPGPNLTERMTRKASSAAQPLVPWARRRRTSDEKKISVPANKDHRDPKDYKAGPPEISPLHVAAAPREGRPFAVATVGNGGRIYLRPTTRPSHPQQQQQSQQQQQQCQHYQSQTDITLPETPFGAPRLQSIDYDKLLPLSDPEHHGNRYTPTSSQTSAAIGAPSRPLDSDDPRDVAPRRRAVSYSTMHTTDDLDFDVGRLAVPELDSGNIERPRTSDESSSSCTGGAPMLNIDIPSWRLGTPRFTIRGTPLIRGSSYTPSEDSRSSGASIWNRARGKRTGAMPNVGPNRLSHLASPHARFSMTSQAHSLRLLRPSRPCASTDLVIEPAMFTDLTFKPACDDPNTVRYATSGTVTAATASRLVAEITSPSFLDYELISDFFLTFRSFLEPELLLQMLIARLRWALARVDETGMIVRVRAFVAIRHWILNYFLDDFILDYSLRTTFCNLLNDFVDEVAQDAKDRKVQLEIVGELKKCWRRICAYYWDGPDFAHSLGVEAPITPGGILGNRDPTLTPIADSQACAAELQSATKSSPTSAPSGFNVECPSTETLDDPLSSIRPRSTRKKSSTDVLRKPKTPVSKRAHLRNDSKSGTGEAAPDCGILQNDAKFTAVLQQAGRLVRGDLLPPGQPFVDVQANARFSASKHRATMIPCKSRSNPRNELALSGLASGYGVKKLFDSVRRALNVRDRDPWLSSHQSDHVNHFRARNQGIVMDGLPGTAVRPKHSSGPHHPVRIDLLGAEIAEDFKKAMREEEAAERASLLIPPKTAPAYSGPQDYSVANMDSIFFEDASENRRQRPASDLPMALGNKMSTIVDGGSSWFDITDPERGGPRLSFFGHSLACSFVPPSGGAPTPPATPFTRAQLSRASRQSSRCFLEPNAYEGRLESLDPSLSSQTAHGGLYNLPPSESTSRASLLPPNTTRQHLPPPISGGLLRMQKKNGPSTSHQPTIRKQASFVGKVGRQSAASSLNHELDAPEAVPQYSLRRRFGDDSRAALNVDDLDVPILRTSQSAATLTTCTESIRGSYLLGAFPSTNPHIQIAADGILPGDRESAIFHQLEDPVNYKVPIIQAPSSTPVMPQCFEQAAGRFAPLSHDEDGRGDEDDEDDGGIESALLKLEGRYRPGRRRLPTREPETVMASSEDGAGINILGILDGAEPGTNVDSAQMPPHERALWLLEGGCRSNPASAVDGERPVTGSQPTFRAESLLYTASHVSKFSDHGVDGVHTDHRLNQASYTAWTDRSVLQFSDDEEEEEGMYVGDNGVSCDEPHEMGQMSFLFDDEANDLEATRLGRRATTMRAGRQTFLDDESDVEMDTSSDLTHDDNQDGNLDEVAAHFPMPRLRKSQHLLPPEFEDPLTQSRPNSPPAPMHMARALEMGLERELFPEQIWATKPLPGTPTLSCAEPFASVPYYSSSYYGSPSVPAFLPSRPSRPSRDREYEKYRKFSIHLPFILAFDADVLAQQFTLIEKDALSDIDWKDLIEMNWKDSTTSDPRSWVEYLKNSDAFGVEVVIARFNLMVKWAVSEMVLTQHVEERARCVSKFIHIAAKCRSYRNFATMAQLTIALTSNEISRLSKTWDLVSECDRTVLNELEKLVTPTRNFYNLRAEMEVGSDNGCIPFVGIYTHDLLYTAQRPSEVTSGSTGSPLINFERFRIVASIVKTVLRLLEASTRYTFEPVEGITERCLWMSALNDDEIRRHCAHLE